jgi:hypothetical protein
MDFALVKKIDAKVIDRRDHPRLKDTLLCIAKGGLEVDLIKEKLFTLTEMSHVAQLDPALKELLNTARELGNEARQAMREDAADTRAIRGIEDPIYDLKGNYVGSRRLYSDTLLALMLKAHNPNKYGTASSASGSGGLVLNVNLGIERDPVKAAKPIVIEEKKKGAV